jgi:tellurite methyltransferase
MHARTLRATGARRDPERVHADREFEGTCDRRYIRDRCVWGEDPDIAVEALAAHIDLRGARVVDVGCGEGRHAAFLARKGATVRALDNSRIAVGRARSRVPSSPGIAWEHSDVRRLALEPASTDVVIACSVLHWLGDEATVAHVLRRLKDATRTGGLHAIVTFNDGAPYEPPAGEVARACLLPHAWYLERYADWEIVDASDRVSVESHPGHLEVHRHAVTRVVARRRCPVARTVAP